MSNYLHLSRCLLVALLAMLAFPVAAGAIPKYETAVATEYPAEFTGSSPKGDPIFKTEAGTIECASHFEGTMEEADSTLNLIPTYTECSAFGFTTATVNAAECDFILHATEKLPGAVYRNTFDIACFKPMTVVAATCEVKYETQVGLQSLTSENSGEGEIFFKPQISGMTYTVTKDGFLCPFKGTGKKTDGKYTGFTGVHGLNAIIKIAGS